MDPSAPRPADDAAARPRGWGGRLELCDPAALDDTARAMYDALLERTVPWAEASGFAARTDDDRLIGPFNGYLLSPEVGRGHQRHVAAEQKHTALPTPIREVVILTVGVAWDAAYEIYAHVAVARSLDVDEAVIDGIRRGTTTDAFSGDQAAAHDFTRALVTTHAVDDATYARAVDAFGEHAVVDMVHLIGAYLATSALLTAFAVPAPPIPDRD